MVLLEISSWGKDSDRYGWKKVFYLNSINYLRK